MSAVGLRASRPANAFFVLPFVAIYALLLLLPLFKGLAISLHDHDLLSNDSFYVGLENFRQLAGDEVFHQVMWNTVRFVAISTPIFVVLALALPTVALVTVWWIIGLPMILFLSALQQIPSDIYEAAALDNTSRWRTLTHITLPALSRTIVLVAVIEVIREFQVFPQIMLMTNGGPNNTTRPIVQFIYEQAFMQLSLGYASAASQVLFAVMLIGVSVQLWLERDRRIAR